MKHENDCKLKAEEENSETSENSWVFQTYLPFYYSSWFFFSSLLKGKMNDIGIIIT